MCKLSTRTILALLLSLLLAAPAIPADIKSAYGTNNQTITVTLASLATAGARESTVVDNTTNKFLDALVFLKVTSGGASTSSAGYVNVYAYGTANGGTTYTQSATGSDAGITLTVPPNARLIGSCNVVANAVTYNCGPFSVKVAFGGVLPDKWGVIIQNVSGGTLDADAGDHAVFYQGVYATSS